MAADPDVFCGCGCSARIWPGMYAYRIGETYYTQGCVTAVVVGQEPTTAIRVLPGPNRPMTPVTLAHPA